MMYFSYTFLSFCYQFLIKNVQQENFVYTMWTGIMLLCTYVYTYVGGWWEGGEWIRYHVIKGISKTNRLLFAHQFSQHWLTTNCVTTDKKWNNRFEERKKRLTWPLLSRLQITVPVRRDERKLNKWIFKTYVEVRTTTLKQRCGFGYW